MCNFRIYTCVTTLPIHKNNQLINSIHQAFWPSVVLDNEVVGVVLWFLPIVSQRVMTMPRWWPWQKTSNFRQSKNSSKNNISKIFYLIFLKSFGKLSINFSISWIHFGTPRKLSGIFWQVKFSVVFWSLKKTNKSEKCAWTWNKCFVMVAMLEKIREGLKKTRKNTLKFHPQSINNRSTNQQKHHSHQKYIKHSSLGGPFGGNIYSLWIVGSRRGSQKN